MDITVIITSLLQLAFAIFMVIGTFIVKKYLPHWLEANFSNSELVAIQNFIAYMIKAAEQLETNGFFNEVEQKRKKKKKYVIEQTKKYCEQYGFTFDEDTISNLIESLIKEIKYPES